MKNKICKVLDFAIDVIITYLFFMLLYISFSFLIVGDAMSRWHFLGAIFWCSIDRIKKKKDAR